MSIFLKENFDKFQRLITDVETVVILGKGPTYSKYNPKDNHSSTFIIGVNDVIVDCYCDMVIANDVETFERLSQESLDRVKYISLAALLQSKKTRKSWIEALQKFNYSYETKHVIPYHLGRYNEQYSDHINLPSSITSSNNAFDLVNMYMPNVKQVNFYGVGVLDNNRYSDPFKGLPYCDEGSYNNDRINKIRNHIKSTCRKNLSIKFN